MIELNKQFIEWGSKNPEKLFLMDGIGAILSACLLSMVLVKFNHIFGIPLGTLYFLAIFPYVFAIFDLYAFNKSHHKSFLLLLKWIAVMNVSYSCLSLGLAFYHYQELTFLGWLYIIGESMIILLLANTEYCVYKRFLS